MGDVKLIDSREIHAGRVVNLCVYTVDLPNGNRATLEIVRHVGAAAVVPIDADGNVVLVRQYRYATDGYLLEIPAGKLDAGEEPSACAAREMEEEVGLRARELIPMGVIWTTPGFTDERIWLFAARNLEPVEQALEADEVLSVERLPMEEAIRRAQTGEIEDGKSVCALLRLPSYL